MNSYNYYKKVNSTFHCFKNMYKMKPCRKTKTYYSEISAKVEVLFPC